MKSQLQNSMKNHLIKNSALYRRLPREFQNKLRQLVNIFLDKVILIAKDIPTITDEMRVCIAAEACILILNRSFSRTSRGVLFVDGVGDWKLGDYRFLQLVEIWRDNPDGISGRAGDANRWRVRLGWQHTKNGMCIPDDNYNVIVHEFAHVIDFADDGSANSIPCEESDNIREAWENLLNNEYPKLLESLKSSHRIPNVLREYAVSSQDRAEFFTCATEAFFERSKDLRRDQPVIYAALKTFYRLDPAEWDDDR